MYTVYGFTEEGERERERERYEFNFQKRKGVQTFKIVSLDVR